MSDDIFSLLKPGQGARVAAERELHRRAEAWGWSSQFEYRGPADFILRHGQFFEGRETPAEYEHLRGPLNRCFANALAAAEADPSLTYTEGVYLVRGEPKAHAWVTAPDGKPVELTFPTDLETLERATQRDGLQRWGYQGVERWAYYGVPFPKTEFVRWCFDHFEIYVSLIDIAELDYPLLRQPWTPLMEKLPDA